jgi:hypothetical protein
VTNAVGWWHLWAVLMVELRSAGCDSPMTNTVTVVTFSSWLVTIWKYRYGSVVLRSNLPYSLVRKNVFVIFPAPRNTVTIDSRCPALQFLYQKRKTNNKHWLSCAKPVRQEKLWRKLKSTQDPRACLHHLHLQLFGLILPALVQVCRRQVSHPTQSVGT